jgi:hypothetical protein
MRPTDFIQFGTGRPDNRFQQLIESAQQQIMDGVGIPKEMMAQMEQHSRHMNFDHLFEEAERTQHPVYAWPNGTVSLVALNVLSNVADPHHGFMKQLPTEVQLKLITRSRGGLYGRKLWWASANHWPALSNTSMRILCYSNGWEGVRRGVVSQDDEEPRDWVKFFCWMPEQISQEEPVELFGTQTPEFWCYDPCFHGPDNQPVVEVELPSVPTVNKEFLDFIEKLPGTSDAPDAWTSVPLADMRLTDASSTTAHQTTADTVQLACCVICGSSDILSTAELQQNKITGAWEVLTSGLNYYCGVCDDDLCNVEMKPFTPAGEPVVDAGLGKPAYGEFMGKAYELGPVGEYFNPKLGEVPDFKQEYQGIPTWNIATRIQEQLDAIADEVIAPYRDKNLTAELKEEIERNLRAELDAVKCSGYKMTWVHGELNVRVRVPLPADHITVTLEIQKEPTHPHGQTVQEQLQEIRHSGKEE